jgi:predicted transcriptional regulator
MKSLTIRINMALSLIAETGGQTKTASAFSVTQGAVSNWTRRGLPRRIEEIARLKFAWYDVWKRYAPYEGL